MSLPEVSVVAGDLSPVVVADEADRSSVTQLNEVLTAQVSARARCLAIDAANLRCIDQATAQALMLAADRFGPRRKGGTGESPGTGT